MSVAIIAGSTGLIGSELLKLLLEEDKVEKVKILLRKPIKTDHTKLEKHIVDFDNLGNYKEIMSADYAFCCLGTTIKKAGSQEAFYRVDHTYVTEFAKLAEQQGAKEFLLISSMGASSKSRVFYNRVKGETEEAVQKIDFRAIHILRPSLLLGDREEKRIGEDLGKKLNKWLNPVIPSKYKGIEATDVAKAMQILSSRANEGVQIYQSDVIKTISSK